MKKLKYSLFVIALLSTFAYTQNSNNNSTTFKVQMTVTERCDIETGQTQDIDFGTIQRSSSNLTAYGSLNVSCTEGTPYAITLHSDKALKNTQDNSVQIPYQLYQDEAYKVVWGNSSQEGFTQSGTGTDQPLKVWAKVEDGKTNVPAGTYTDTVVATVTY
ncbi:MULTISPECIES: Csu type fimbrial protein [Acinetobacter]|jgi:spore coat protein U-like protein|uniref:Csu type fimbrial protein n=1 Tax=Acinetobacter TaxID=469 RepID=UPI0015D1C840|nr:MULTISPECIES: spore coat U domain-containing protein [Acinetobacter]MDM1342545.1 spore coat protein U domain-containing protein [Acinetobacter pseudolwoffii]